LPALEHILIKIRSTFTIHWLF